MRIGSPRKWITKGKSSASAVGTTAELAKPMKRMGSERMKLTAGPAIPMSKRTERYTIGPRNRMNAPSVPTSEK